MGPDRRAVERHLQSARFLVGLARKWWRVLDFGFPELTMGVAHCTAEGVRGESAFRFELTNYPVSAPWVRIWDAANDCILSANSRPSWDARTREAFKVWSSGQGIESVYRPWDRYGLAHNNWATHHPALAWNSSRELSFALEDLHAILNSADRSSVHAG